MAHWFHFCLFTFFKIAEAGPRRALVKTLRRSADSSDNRAVEKPRIIHRLCRFGVGTYLLFEKLQDKYLFDFDLHFESFVFLKIFKNSHSFQVDFGPLQPLDSNFDLNCIIKCRGLAISHECSVRRGL